MDQPFKISSVITSCIIILNESIDDSLWLKRIAFAKMSSH